MNKNFIFIFLGIILISFATVRIASNNTIFYYTTSEAAENVNLSDSERLKLGGFVVNETISKTSTEETRFKVTDGNLEIVIIFDGYIPELFQEEMGVILDGYFKNEIFYSDDMLVKHDNEYISEDGQTYDVENFTKWFLILELF